MPSLKYIGFREVFTSGIHLSRRTYVLLFLQPLKYIFQSHHSPSDPVYTQKAQKFFGFTRLFDSNMKMHVKTTRGKRLSIPSRTNHRRYIVYHSRLSSLATNHKPQNSSINAPGMHLSRRTYVPLFLQTVQKVYHSVQPVPLWTEHSKLSGFTRPFDFNMKIRFKTTATYTIQNES